MTVPIEKPFQKFTYTGPGDFPVDFTITEANDIKVTHYIPDTSIVRLVPGQDYTLTWAPYEKPTLHLTYDVQPYQGDIQVRRDIPVSQDTDWINQGPFDQELLERNLDKLTMIIQDTLFLADYDANRNWRGEWKPNTAYNLHDMVTGPDGTNYELSTFSALLTHESSDDFEQDLNAGLWQIIIDMTYLYELAEQVEQDANRAEAAKTGAETARDAAVAAEQAASGHASDAEQYAIQAGDYVGQASQHATKASQWADNPVDTPVEGSRYSAYHWAQKAAEYGGINELSTSDTDMLLIQTDDTNPKHKIIHINSDVASGIPKLDARGNIKFDQLPTTLLHLIGPLRGDDTCPKPGDQEGDCTDPDYRNPSERWPGTNWPDGGYFIISSAGSMNLMNSAGNYEVTPVAVGDAVLYVKDGIVLPEGWYHIQGDQVGDIIASMVLFDDSSTVIKGSNVQSWNQAADTEITNRVKKTGDTMTGPLSINHIEPAYRWIEDAQPNDSPGQTWELSVNDLIMHLRCNEDNSGSWLSVADISPDGVFKYLMALPEGPDAVPNKDLQLVNKRYVDTGFLSKAAGGTVAGPVSINSTLACTGPFNVTKAYMKDTGALAIGYETADIITYDPATGKATIEAELHLPDNVGATDPRQPL